MSARDGFTLLEAVVSLLILGMVGIAALGAVGGDLDAATRSRSALAAAALAEDRLEAVRLLEAADLARLPDSVAAGAFDPPFEDYRWRAEAEPAGEVAGLYDIRVEVSGDGASRVLAARLYRPANAGAGGSP